MRFVRLSRLVSLLGLLALVPSCTSAPPTAEGAASILLSDPPRVEGAPAKLCPMGQQAGWSNVPYRGPRSEVGEEGRPVTARGAVVRVADGKDGFKVRCSVVPRGDKFAVTGYITPPVSATQRQVGVGISVVIGPGEVGVPGAFSLTDSIQSGAQYQGKDCVFSVRAENGNALTVEPGKIVATVSCTNVRDSADMAGDHVCVVRDHSAVVFESCETE